MDCKTYKIKINGLHHQTYHWGKEGKPQIFLVHGWMDSGANFAFLAQQLAKRYHLIALDLRGFGKTQKTKNPLGYFFYEYVKDLDVFFDFFSKDTPVCVLGHSMGGNIVSLYAGAKPTRVSYFLNLEGLGIVDCPIADSPRRLKKWLDSFEFDFHHEETIQAMAQKLAKNIGDVDLAVVNKHTRPLVKKTAKGYVWRADPKHRWINPYPFQLKLVAEFWKNIQARVLFLYGEKSRFGFWLNPAEDGLREIKKRLAFYPQEKLTIQKIADCGHHLHWQKPKEVSHAVISFLEKTT